MAVGRLKTLGDVADNVVLSEQVHIAINVLILDEIFGCRLQCRPEL